jgi:cell division septum initiation protein DivIVA
MIHNGVLESLSKADLIDIVKDQQQRIEDLEKEVADLKNQVASQARDIQVLLERLDRLGPEG